MIRQSFNDMKTFLHIALWLVVLLLVVMSSKAVLGLSAELVAPTTAYTGDTITIIFGSDDYTATNTLSVDGAVVASTSPYFWTADNYDVGSHTLLATATLAGGLTSTVQRTLAIEENISAFILHEPAQTEYASQSIPVELLARQTVDTCEVETSQTIYPLSGQNGLFTGQLTLSEGIHTLMFRCSENNNVIEQERTILIDTIPPQILEITPQNGAIVSANPEIVVLTDEVANCEIWHTGQTDKRPMTSTDKLTHHYTGPFTKGTNAFTFACADIYGTINVPSSITFTYEDVLTARVEIKDVKKKTETDVPILSAGTYEVNLLTSHDIEMPTLQYALQQGGTRTIALEKETAQKWIGFLVIEDDAGEESASFTFSARNTDGAVGTEITDGRLFLIDTKAPDQLEGVEIDSFSDRIELSWSSEKDDGFIIYRSEKQKITKADEYARTETTTYTDTDVLDAVEYYYAVAAIDKAGNIGPLSTVVYGAAVPQRTEAEKQIRNAEQEYEAGLMIENIDRFLLDIDAAYEQLETEQDEDKLIFIRELEMLEQLTTLRAEMKALQRELETLSQQGLSPENFHARIVSINEKLLVSQKMIPTQLTIKSSAGFEQASDNTIINKYVSELPEKYGSLNRQQYLALVQDIMDGTTIDGEILVLERLNKDRSEEFYTYIKKDISFPLQERPLSLVEHIPREVSEAPEQLSFTPQFDSYHDAAVEFSLPANSRSYSLHYLIKGDVGLANARLVRSVLLPQVSVLGAESLITGRSVSFFGESFFQGNLFYIFGGLLIAGLLIYYFTMDAGPRPQMNPALPNTSVMNTALTASPASMDAFLHALTEKLSALSPPSIPSQQDPQSYFQNSPSNTFFKRRDVGQQKGPLGSAHVGVRRSASNSLRSSASYYPPPSSSGAVIVDKHLPSFDLSRTEEENFARAIEEFAEQTTSLKGKHSPENLQESNSRERTSQKSNPQEGILQEGLSEYAMGASDLSRLLKDAHTAIDNKEYLEAKKRYELASRLSPMSALANEERRSLQMLYNKLLFFQQMGLAADAERNKQLPELNLAMERLRALAQKLPEEESALITDAKERFRTLSKAANRLAIAANTF